MVDFQLLARRRRILSRVSLPAHLRHIPDPSSLLHLTSVPTTRTPAGITRSTKRPCRISSLQKLPPPIETADFPSPYRHHYISFHTPASHFEMVCPWIWGVPTWQVRGPTRGVWVNRAKLVYKQFEIRGMEEYMDSGEDEEWETDDDEGMGDGRGNGGFGREDVEQAAGLLLDVAAGGAVDGDGEDEGDYVMYEGPENVGRRDRVITMPDFEPYADVGLFKDDDRELRDSGGDVREGCYGSEASMFL